MYLSQNSSVIENPCCHYFCLNGESAYIFIPNPCKKSLNVEVPKDHFFQNIQNLPHIRKNFPIQGKMSDTFHPNQGVLTKIESFSRKKTPTEEKCRTVDYP